MKTAAWFGFLKNFYRNLLFLSSISLIALFGANRELNAQASIHKNFNLEKLYSDSIAFEVIRNGEKIGTHKVYFERGGEGWKVRSIANMEIRFLAFFSYQYKYESEGFWMNGELEALSVNVNDDGKHFEMLATRSGTKMKVKFQDKAYTTSAPIIPTNHWNPHVLGRKRVLNTLTGKVNKVTLVAKGQEIISSESGDIAANRYVYTGDLEDTEVWYDDTGRWVKLRFLGRDGTPVEYICQKCSGNG